MPANAIPTVDLDTWRTDPAAVAAQVDTALQRAGFGTVTMLDREPGAGGLQVFVTAADDPDGPGVWQDAPHDPDDGQHRRPARSPHSLAALGRRFANAR